MITVTVCVVTYNHEKYIDDCIQSIVNQVHDFQIEILIHDDASTDGTTNKIRNWQKKYPDLVFPILQKENQYSIEPIIAPKFIFPRARGVYLAMCEGDDYWTSTDKLRAQVERLEQNPAINLCYHPSKKVSEAGIVLGSQGFNGDCEKFVSASEVLTGGGGFIPTAAIMFRATCVKLLTEFFNNNVVPNGDRYIQAITAFPGGAIYLPKTMAAYRYESFGSWTEKKNSMSIVSARKLDLWAVAAVEGLLECGYTIKDLNRANSMFAETRAMFYLEHRELTVAREMLTLSMRNSIRLNTRKIFLILCLYVFPGRIKFWLSLINRYRYLKRKIRKVKRTNGKKIR